MVPLEKWKSSDKKSPDNEGAETYWIAASTNVYYILNANGKIDVTNSKSTNEIIQENHYYAFDDRVVYFREIKLIATKAINSEGTATNRIAASCNIPWLMNNSAKDNFYMYNSKEYNNDHALNWSDYGARWYDAAIGRWATVDPMSESTVNLSPYNYGLNNPILYIDPDGMKAVYSWSTGGYYDDETGESRTWDDVQKEYSTGSYSETKNALILPKNISGDEALSNIFYSANNTNGAVFPILASSTKDASSQMSNLFKEGQLDNLYIGSHGEYANQTFSVGDNSHYSTANPITDLYSISKFVNSNGNFVLLACHVGREDENDGSQLLISVSMSAKRNVFGSRSWGCAGCGDVFNSKRTGNCPQDWAKRNNTDVRGRGYAFDNIPYWTKVEYNNAKPKVSIVKNVTIKNGNFTYED